MVTRKEEPKKDKDRIEVITGNVPLVSVQMLNSINQNLISILAYLKNRDLNRK